MLRKASAFLTALFCLNLPAGATEDPPADPSSVLGPRWHEVQQDYVAQALIENFYSAFARGDAQAMAACYHPEAKFHDPIFGSLHGAEIGHMWQMLLTLSKGQLKLHFQVNDAHLGLVRAHWEADYTFSATGFPVHNVIESEFELREGLIYRQRDHFDLHRWSSQALGTPGFLFGGLPLFQNLLQRQVRTRLQSWHTAP